MIFLDNSLLVHVSLIQVCAIKGLDVIIIVIAIVAVSSNELQQ